MHNDDENVSNSSDNQTFQEVVESRLSRRNFLGGSLAAVSTAYLGGVGSLLEAVPAAALDHTASRLLHDLT